MNFGGTAALTLYPVEKSYNVYDMFNLFVYSYMGGGVASKGVLSLCLVTTPLRPGGVAGTAGGTCPFQLEEGFDFYRIQHSDTAKTRDEAIMPA